MKGIIHEVFQKYDPQNLGCLDRCQILEVLKDLNSDKPPTEDELDYILAVADQAESNNQPQAKRVYRNQLMAAVDAWKTYKDNEGTINEYFDRYDVSKTGSLGKKQLCQLLTDLDTGKVPSETELNYIIFSADRKVQWKDGKINRAINRPELMYAIGLWYALVGEERERIQAESEVCVIQ